MSGNVLIVGRGGLLASHLAAFRLLSTDDTILFDFDSDQGPFSDNELSSLVGHAIRQIAADAEPASFEHRLHRAVWEPDGEQPGSLSGRHPVSEVWWIAGSSPGANTSRGLTDISALLAALPQLGVTEFNYVEPACKIDKAEQAGGRQDEESGSAQSITCEQVVEHCKANGLGCRIFRTSLIIGQNPPVKGPDREGFLQFLWAVHDLKREIEERLPDYFEYQCLRCIASPDATLNLIRVDQAAEIMMLAARRPAAPGHSYYVGGPESVSVADICDRAGMVFGLSLIPVEDHDSLNAIDRVFKERLNGFQVDSASFSQEACGETYRELDLDSDRYRLDEETQIGILEAVFTSQEAERTALNQRVASMPDTLERRSIDRGGSELVYYAAGSGGPPVLLLNALGQGLQYWYRLIDNLMRRRRVVVWEPRGTLSGPQPFSIQDQVDDVEAVLQHEGADACHLVAWCTAPKVAVEFYLRHPDSVPAMVFLNSAFKCLGSPAEMATAYEHNFEPICRILQGRPAMAGSIMKSLQSSVTDSEIDLMAESDGEELSVSVLSLMNRDMKEHVTAPFRSEEALVNYSHQILDFWAYDTQESAERVQIPVLFMVSEYDQIASSEMSRAVASLFPKSNYVEVTGATHYCLYDRPDFVGSLIERFFRNPEGFNRI